MKKKAPVKIFVVLDGKKIAKIASRPFKGQDKLNPPHAK